MHAGRSEPRRRIVAGQQLRLGLRFAGEPLFQDLGNPGVQLLAAALEQGLVGRILNEGVLEDVAGVGRGAAAEDQLGRCELVEG